MSGVKLYYITEDLISRRLFGPHLRPTLQPMQHQRLRSQLRPPSQRPHQLLLPRKPRLLSNFRPTIPLSFTSLLRFDGNRGCLLLRVLIFFCNDRKVKLVVVWWGSLSCRCWSLPSWVVPMVAATTITFVGCWYVKYLIKRKLLISQRCYLSHD